MVILEICWKIWKVMWYAIWMESELTVEMVPKPYVHVFLCRYGSHNTNPLVYVVPTLTSSLQSGHVSQINSTMTLLLSHHGAVEHIQFLTGDQLSISWLHALGTLSTCSRKSDTSSHHPNSLLYENTCLDSTEGEKTWLARFQPPSELPAHATLNPPTNLSPPLDNLAATPVEDVGKGMLVDESIEREPEEASKQD